MACMKANILVEDHIYLDEVNIHNIKFIALLSLQDNNLIDELFANLVQGQMMYVL